MSLWQFAFQRFRERRARVGRPGDAHGGINIGTAGERIANGAADAGGSAAEGLDLGRVIVGFVLEEQQPRFFFAIDGDIDMHRAGIDFFGNVFAGEFTVLTKRPCGQKRHVHKTDGLGIAGFLAQRKIGVIGFLQQRIRKRHVVNNRTEGRMAAMIGPIGINHANLGFGRIALFLPEIRLAEEEIVIVHSQAHITT